MQSLALCATCGAELGDPMYCLRCGMPVAAAPAKLEGRRGFSKLVVVAASLLALTLGLLALLPWLHSFEKFFVAGMAASAGLGGSVATAGNWWARKPIIYRGPIYHSDRPAAYHLVSAVLFCFSGCLGVVGLVALLKWTLS